MREFCSHASPATPLALFSPVSLMDGLGLLVFNLGEMRREDEERKELGFFFFFFWLSPHFYAL